MIKNYLLPLAALLLITLNSAIAETTEERISFYDAVNSNWLRDTSVPADEPGITNFKIIERSINEELKAVLEDQSSSAAANEEIKKAQALYNSYIHFEERDDAGIDPIEKDLEAIDALKDHREVALHFARFLQMGVTSPVVFIQGPDFKNSTAYLLWASQSGLGMPARAMYLDQDERSGSLRELYKKHLENLFDLADLSSEEETASEVLAFESELAQIQWSPEQTRDVLKTYNVVSMDELSAILKNVPLKEMTALLGIPEGAKINASELSYLVAFDQFFVSKPLASWKSYLKARLLMSYSNLLTSEFHEADFEYKKALGLVDEDSPRWKQALEFTQSAAPMLVGKLYVERYFDKKKRTQVEEIVQEILTSAREVISKSTRLADKTKKRALQKLNEMAFNIGYPDVWRDYSTLEVTGDVVQNFKNASLYELNRSYSKLLRPVDRNEWERSPHEVNAFYDPTQNKFVLLAGILKPPFYNGEASLAGKYGGLGFVIGHEIGHAFDDNGSHFDQLGTLNNWWSEADRKRFNKVRDAYILQANNFEILPGTHLNGELQIGEILGDATGATLSLNAFDKVIAKQKLDRKASYQEFYRQLAVVWREKYRPELQKLLIATDPHPPGKFRTDGIVKNMNAFYKAFDIKPGDPMYVAPSQRLSIW